MKVLRSMMAAPDQKPEIEGLGKNSARTIGVRTSGMRADIEPDDRGLVYPASDKGMSVSPPPPENLPKHRRPPEFGGTGKDSVWEMETEHLPLALVYTADPKDPEGHGLIGPSEIMFLDIYLEALYSTRDLWRLY